MYRLRQALRRGLESGLRVGVLLAASGPGAACAAGDADAPPPSCSPQVQIAGDAALRSALAEALGRRAIRTDVIRGCPSLRAEVTRQGPLVRVVLQEDVPREERLVADLHTVVALIETWLRSDISAPLLSALLLPPELAAPPAAAAIAPPSPPPAHRLQVRAELLPEVGIDLRAAPWLGGALRGCLQAGPVCLGALWRMAGSLPAVDGEGTRRQRMIADVLVTAEWPLRSGRLTFAPGIGLGAGWLRTQLNVPPVEEEESDEQILQLTVNDGGMRAELRALLAVDLYRGLALALSVSGQAAFLDGSATTHQVSEHRSVTSDVLPWGALRLGLGLRWSL